MSAHTFNVLSRFNRNNFTFYSLYASSKDTAILFYYYSLIASHTRLSHIHSHKTSRKFRSTSTFFVGICHTHKDRWVDYPNQDSIYLYARLHQENTK